MKKPARHSVIFFVIVLLMILFPATGLTGCRADTGLGDLLVYNSGPEETEPGAADQPENDSGGKSEVDYTVSFMENYRIPTDAYSYWGETYWVIDREGNTIPDDRQYRVLYDSLTGEPLCLTKSRTDVLKRSEEGEIAATIELSALYDLEENVISDWSECTYSMGFGDYIFKQKSNPQYMYWNEESYWDDIECELWNYRTKEVHLKDAFYAMRLSDDEALLIDVNYRLMGVMDRTGAERAGFPVPERYTGASAWNGYILAQSETDITDDGQVSYHDFLLTAELEELLIYDRLSGSDSGNLLKYTDDIDTPYERRGVITVTGDEIYGLGQGESVHYFDENFIIVQYDDIWMYRVVRTSDGEVLCDGVERVTYTPPYRETSDNILIYKDGYIQIINSKDGPGPKREVTDVLYIESYGNRNYHVAIYKNEKNMDMILDENLNEVIPTGVYEYSFEASRWNGLTEEYLGKYICTKPINRGMSYTMDFLDSDGSILVADLNSIFAVGPDRLAVRKGFAVGLMDWHGNWIVKKSVFSGLQD